MAKHFKTAPEESTAPMKRTVRQRVGDTTGMTSLPYGQVASYHYSYPSAALRTDEYDEELPARGGIYLFGRAMVLLLAWILRFVGLALFAFVIANALSLPWGRQLVVRATDVLTSYLPWQAAGALVMSMDTPFGGAFRLDLAALSLLAFILDWALCRLRMRLL